jgi:sugar porter (SP) family MFS transporter
MALVTQAHSGSRFESQPAEKYNRVFVWLLAVIAAMGGLLFGYDWVVIGGAKPFYEKYFGLTSSSEIGWAMSCALIGCLAGAIVSGGLSDRFGRKRLLMLSGILFAGSSVGTGMAHSFDVFVLNRILGGVAIGLCSNLSPMYIAEIAPAAARGRLVSVNQLTIVIGILLAQVVNLWIAEPVPAGFTTEQIRASWNGQAGWRWMFGVTAIPSTLFFLLLMLAPETPRWLARNGQLQRARGVLARIGGAGYADATIEEIAASLGHTGAKLGLEPVFEPRMRGVLVLGIVLAVFQQWCGINVVFNYAEEIFSAAGYRVSDILFNIVITGAANLVFTLVAIFTCDRLGRRKLMLIGSAGLAVIYTLIGLGYYRHTTGPALLGLVLAAICFYACSLAPVTWVLISEIFPNRIRGAAMSITVFALWAACFTLTYTFPALNAGLGSAGTFWIYAGICVAGFLFIKLRLPETRGKTLEQIELQLLGPVPVQRGDENTR